MRDGGGVGGSRHRAAPHGGLRDDEDEDDDDEDDPNVHQEKPEFAPSARLPVGEREEGENADGVWNLGRRAVGVRWCSDRQGPGEVFPMVRSRPRRRR